MALTFSVYVSKSGPKFPDLVTGVTRERAEQVAARASCDDPQHCIHIIERDADWRHVAEYRNGKILLTRPHDRRALEQARKAEVAAS